MTELELHNKKLTHINSKIESVSMKLSTTKQITFISRYLNEINVLILKKIQLIENRPIEQNSITENQSL